MPLLRKLLAAHCAASLACHVAAFAPPPPPSRCAGAASSSRRRFLQKETLPPRPPAARTPTHLHESGTDGNGSDLEKMDATPDGCWNPALRKQLAVISALGVVETAYLTYDKVQYAAGGKASALVGALCSDGGGASSCSDVLHGPYASLHLGGVDVPLSSVGMAAYATVFVLAALPLLSSEASREDGETAVVDGTNRIALLGGTTLMASFSVYLVSLLVGVLHKSCLFCFASAGLSFTLAALSWFGGMLPNEDEIVNGDGALSEVAELRKKGLTAGASSVGLATVAALGVFLGVSDEAGNYNALAASSPAASSGTLVASSGATKILRENVPPPITTTSSVTALTLASDMKSLNARMFGAFWCSHCYDQKQALGYEAMQSLPYIECDREGYNNQRDMCKARDVPGYPTWEIGGKLFPGERSLEELREIVDDVLSAR